MNRILAPLALLLAIFATQFSQAQELADFPDPTQNEVWFGTFEQPKQHFRILISWPRENSDGQGTMLNVDQAMTKVPVASIKLSDAGLSLEAPSVNGKFEGKRIDSSTISGDWVQNGRTTTISFRKIESFPKDEAQLVLRGKLNALVRSMDFQFRFYDLVESEAEFKSTLGLFDSLTENVGSIVCSYREKDGNITIECPAINATFTGTRDRSTGLIDGTFKQGLIPLPLKLEPTSVVLLPGSKNSVLERPQTPSSPLPYREEEFLAKNPAAKDVTLAGTLTLPQEKGKYPAVILVSGSGPQDRDETLLGHKPFLVIADHLTRHGIAVLRFDDRGVQKSTGDHSQATSDDFATDTDAVLQLAKKHPEIDPTRIAILGHSEGGLIAPIVASWNPDLAGLVLLAGPGCKGSEILEQQSDRIIEQQGASVKARKTSLEMRREIQSLAMSPIPDEFTSERIQAIVTKYWPALHSDNPNSEISDPVKQEGLIQSTSDAFLTLSNPWFRRFLAYDPGATLMLVQCPTLALFGELDVQVLPKVNLERMKQSIERSGNSHFRMEIVPGVNHLFQPAQTGSPNEYEKIAITVEPAVLDTMLQWLKSIGF